MVMILPRQPGWGEVLGQALGGGAVGGLQGYAEGREKAQDKRDKELQRIRFAEAYEGRPLGSVMNELQGPAAGGQALPQREPLSREQAIRAATLGGLSPQEIALIDKSYLAREKNNIARERFEFDKEQAGVTKKASDVRAERAEQKVIDTQNEPFILPHKTLTRPYETLGSSVDEAIDIVKSGKAESGTFGGIGPNRLRNAATRRLDGLFNNIVNQLTQVSSELGNPTEAKQRLIQAAKAGLDQPAEVQLAVLNSIKHDVNSFFDEGKAIQAVIKENNGKQPRDLHFAVRDYLQQKENKREQKSQQKASNVLEKLPAEDRQQLNPSLWQEGSIIKVNGQRIQMVNGNWIEA